MAARIATLIDLGWDPVHPFKWLTPDRTRQTNSMDSDAAHHRVTHDISKILKREYGRVQPNHIIVGDLNTADPTSDQLAKHLASS